MAGPPSRLALRWATFACRATFACIHERRLERETGIEPATNSLEGCDSTTELLPPSRRSLRPPPLRCGRPACSALYDSLAAYSGQARRLPNYQLGANVQRPLRRVSAARRNAKHCGKKNREGRPLPPTFFARLPRAPNLHARASRAGKVGGEGRVRTSVARWAADLQSAAIDRSATSPKYISCDFFEVPLPSTSVRPGKADAAFRARLLWISVPVSSETVGHCPQACTCHGVRAFDVSLKGGVSVRGAGGGI